MKDNLKKFSSIYEICDEFNIDKSLSSEEILIELTNKQKELHPDNKKDADEDDIKVFTRLDEAKEFIRSNSKNELIAVSQVVEIIKSMNLKEISPYEEEEKLQSKISSSKGEIIKNLKQKYLPKKLTVAGIMAVITALWAFPSIIMDNPIFANLMQYYEFYCIISIIWMVSLTTSILLLLPTYKKEIKIKKFMWYLEQEETQYKILYSFISQRKGEKKNFSIDEFEAFIYDWLIWDSYYNPLSSLKYEKRKAFINSVSDIIPKIRDIIIFRASKKGIIKKQNNKNWYDNYVVNTNITETVRL